MITKLIKCSVCDECMVRVEKDDFTEVDEQNYIISVNCSSGHGATIVVDEED